jgi:pimeloyl-ACP methyl ester carboxylesterase
MAQREVHIHGKVSAPAETVWAMVRDFCGAWHPALASVVAEEGGLVRRFTVKGEDTIYRERLTFFSDSDFSYSYTHLDGIRDVESYEASFTVSALDDLTSQIDWQATVIAPEPRAGEIARGTELVFQSGIDEVCRLAPRSKTLKDGAAIAITRAGKPSENVCIFLHGIGGGRQNWARQLPVAAQFMQSAAMDLRGYGDSELGPQRSTIDDYCNDILRVMKDCKATLVVLCGLSYGSWIATSFAMRHANKVAGLILSGGCTGMSEARIEEQIAFRNARESPLNVGKTPRDFARAVVNIIASPHANDHVRKELYDSMAAIPAATYRDAVQCFTQPQEIFDFTKLNMPCLFMTGEYDCLAKPEEIRGVARRVHVAAKNPNVRFEIIPNAGHVCNVEAPVAYNAVLASFLKSLVA